MTANSSKGIARAGHQLGHAGIMLKLPFLELEIVCSAGALPALAPACERISESTSPDPERPLETEGTGKGDPGTAVARFEDWIIDIVGDELPTPWACSLACLKNVTIIFPAACRRRR